VCLVTKVRHCFQVYKKVTKNDPEGKVYRIYLQLWDTAGQERYVVESSLLSHFKICVNLFCCILTRFGLLFDVLCRVELSCNCSRVNVALNGMFRLGLRKLTIN